MRISTSWGAQQAVNQMLDRQYQLSQTQLALGNGKAIQTPSDNPAAAARAVDVSSASAQNDQYTRNINSATTRLSTEETALTSAGNILDRIRSITLEGVNGTQTDESRQSIATELRQTLNQLVALGNSKDGQGEYIFAGSRTTTQPFTIDGLSVSYGGDQTQRMVAAAAGLQVATGDSGDDVFMSIRGGNGTFVTTAGATNTGSAVVGGTSVTDATQWDGGNYTVNFTSATTYEIHDAADPTGTPLSTGTYTGTSGTISFKGAQLNVTGTPAAGDSFSVGPSSSQDVFSTIAGIINAFEAPGGGAAMNNQVNAQLQNLDQAATSLLNTRTKIGARMNTLDQQSDIGSDVKLSYDSTLSDLTELDYASAASKYTQQQTALDAAQQAYVKMQNLSLFNYLK
ncbi:MAG: flagellar hook-associated protein FlgL [Luteibacter sp.]|jgi:flagellar hook-associated protein 3 FlgL|uniref:flagellar hook-associated protein FlgL n=1 Tax=unclassified Luteibacter TaxID=2620188 RepID=UPI0028095FAF|nr:MULTISPECIES: flagellar hook-associated protein FlgL [unclassified Luteibacter]MDQ7997009.1 flagellar hook-associated protein FlgL [Luteibacter sp.]MDQ8050920.1 flagellar hook-associated protein FlgL [Luteibacter sp.]MDR6643233.1 flagellar hook-associated protein 3 FlgL [Luteibacter sp. 1214]